jgi:hypothetical protein
MVDRINRLLLEVRCRDFGMTTYVASLTYLFRAWPAPDIAVVVYVPGQGARRRRDAAVHARIAHIRVLSAIRPDVLACRAGT